MTTGVDLITNGHVEATAFELTVLLAQGTGLAEAMNTAIPARMFL